MAPLQLDCTRSDTTATFHAPADGACPTIPGFATRPHTATTPPPTNGPFGTNSSLPQPTSIFPRVDRGDRADTPEPLTVDAETQSRPLPTASPCRSSHSVRSRPQQSGRRSPARANAPIRPARQPAAARLSCRRRSSPRPCRRCRCTPSSCPNRRKSRSGRHRTDPPR